MWIIVIDVGEGMSFLYPVSRFTRIFGIHRLQGGGGGLISLGEGAKVLLREGGKWILFVIFLAVKHEAESPEGGQKPCKV